MSILDRPSAAAAMEYKGRLSRGALFLCLHALALLCLASTGGVAAHAQRLAAGEHADPPPGDLADPISPLIANGGQRVRVGDTTLEFWWVKSLPLTEDSRGVSWSGLAEGTLVGAVTLSAPYPDANGQMVPTGTYTLRCVTQPAAIGNRRAAAAANVLLLSPVADDDKTDPTGRDDAMALAKQTPGASAAPEWRIDAAGPGPGPVAAAQSTAADDHALALTVTLPASRDGMDVGALTFDVVLIRALRP